MEKDVKLAKSGVRWGAFLTATFLLSGCLLLAKVPVNDIGEECEKGKHCPSWAFCGLPEGATSAVCLPLEDECGPGDDAVCGNYACEEGAVNYCHRFCEASADCKNGYGCENFDTKGKGECVEDPYSSGGDEDECSDSDLSACGGYGCISSIGYCRSICFDGDDCAPGYDCYDDECL